MAGVSRGWFFALFGLSGFSGLIYESLWSHYLKLFLGHAAYAQSLVLAILMGGMAIGAWGCGRLARRWRNLLAGYAMAEAVVGICAVGFHSVFIATTGFAYDVGIPALASPLAADALRWLLATALILPQSILLGATFPLMSAGVLRAYPERAGATIATLYFTNSLGAALGVLASGFVLVEALGLPGTMLAAGLVNLALALVVWLLGRGLAQPAPKTPIGVSRAIPAGYRLMLSVSLLTGMASFMYEIGWIRMLSLVLGASTQAFELMLSAFLFGLAFGGLWIRRRIDGAASPETWLGVIQVLMGACALATLPVYGRTFELMQWLLQATGRTDGGYALFNVGSHAIALLVMFPAAFCAGMTLPLITRILLLRGGGEQAIGSVYAANTVGAIAGVAVATHLAMPLLGLKGLITLGATLDIALGAALLWRFAGRGLLAPVASTLGGGALVAVLALVELDALKMASGVYRDGKLLRPGEAQMLFHRDGKTATVNLLRDGARVSIITNGKSDAMVDLAPGGPPSHDEPVMLFTGALPAVLHPAARTAAVIGIGSGISSHTLLGSTSIQEVDTIEIEPMMVAAARGFHPRNAAVFSDPRSRLHIEDAKTFFSVHGKRYDIVVSMPSNPWVSGVASLFTEEFYRRVRRHLAEDGLFVQWLQIYETETALVASVMKALVGSFPHYDVYSPDDHNLVVVARMGGAVPRAQEAAFRQPSLAAALARLQIRHPVDLEHFRLGDRRFLHPFFDRYAIPANSDYFPVLDQNAARARFLGLNAGEIVRVGSLLVPAGDFLGGAPARAATPVPPRTWLKRSTATHQAQRTLAYLLHGDPAQLEDVPLEARTEAQWLRLALVECAPRAPVAPGQLVTAARRLLPYLATGEGRALWQAMARCRPEAPLADWVALFAAIDARDAGAMSQRAEKMLAASDLGSESHADLLLAAAILGRLSAGGREEAMALWRRYAPSMRSDKNDVTPELLHGHLFAAGRTAP